VIGGVLGISAARSMARASSEERIGEMAAHRAQHGEAQSAKSVIKTKKRNQ